jgi:hypothetical protein
VPANITIIALPPKCPETQMTTEVLAAASMHREIGATREAPTGGA